MYTGRGANPSLCIISSASGLDAILERFWQVDDFDRGRALSLDDRWCEDHFNRTVSRRDDGRYVVRLPLREDRRPFLGDSYNLAQRRFLANERRFGYDQQLRDDYLRFMDEYAELGHLEPGLRTGNAAYRPRFLETMDSGLRSSFASTSKMAPRHSKPSGRRVSFVETREPSAVAMEHRANNRHTSGQRRQVQGGRRPHHKGNLPACRSRSMPAANRNREQQIRKPSPAPDAAPDKPARTVKLSEARFKETDEAESE
ncbi:uncharacterized protein LOC120427921 [Culex pipiens pallens]|nr:uncharacterized protein LOC120427921 [Culex pipiens pallens]